MATQWQLKTFQVSYRAPDGTWFSYPEGESNDYSYSEDVARDFAIGNPNHWVRVNSHLPGGEPEFEFAYQFFEDNPKHPSKRGLYISYGNGWQVYEGD